MLFKVNQYSVAKLPHSQDLAKLWLTQQYCPKAILCALAGFAQVRKRGENRALP